MTLKNVLQSVVMTIMLISILLAACYLSAMHLGATFLGLMWLVLAVFLPPAFAFLATACWLKKPSVRPLQKVGACLAASSF